MSAVPCAVCGSPSVASITISVMEPSEYELFGHVCAEHLREVQAHAALYHDPVAVRMTG